MHGHFLDRHLTIPTFEPARRRDGGARSWRATSGRPAGAAGGEEPITLDEYESAQAPVYALLYALAQASAPSRVTGAGPSARVWQALGGGEGRGAKVRGWLLGTVAVPGAVGVANRLGLGPVRYPTSRRARSRAPG